MKGNPLIKRIVAINIVVVTVWLFWPTMPTQAPVQQQSRLEKTTIALQEHQLKTVKKNHQAITTTTTTATNITSNDSATLVAKAYAGEITYPPYSRPLNANDYDRLKPNYFNPQTIPVDDNGNTLTAKLSKYRYTYPEPIQATLIGENIKSAKLQLIDLSTGKQLHTKSFKQDENNWYVQLDGERDFPDQLQATVKADVNGRNISLALSLKYVDSIATLESFQPAVSSESDMLIHANLNVLEKGLYRVRANLFDANQQPVAHLVSKERLNKGNESIALKAHLSVLKGRQTPLYLSTFSIELMSPAPGQPTRYGDSAINKYQIKDFAISSLSDIPYQATIQEQQRLQLLQNMSKQ